jgi:hypothetical protein
MKEMTVEEAIGRAPGMSVNRYRDVKIIEEPCPKCGSQVVCAYDDLGATDYYDNYAHVCLNPDCDFLLHRESFSCNLGGRSGGATERCVFCRRDIQMTW